MNSFVWNAWIDFGVILFSRLTNEKKERTHTKKTHTFNRHDVRPFLWQWNETVDYMAFFWILEKERFRWSVWMAWLSRVKKTRSKVVTHIQNSHTISEGKLNDKKVHLNKRSYFDLVYLRLNGAAVFPFHVSSIQYLLQIRLFIRFIGPKQQLNMMNDEKSAHSLKHTHTHAETHKILCDFIWFNLKCCFEHSSWAHVNNASVHNHFYLCVWKYTLTKCNGTRNS